MLIAVADLRMASPRVGLVELHGPHATPLVEPSDGELEESVLHALLDATEQVHARIREIAGYVICSGSVEGSIEETLVLRGLALANRRPLVEVSALRAMALEASKRAPIGSTLVALGRQDGELAAGIFRADVTGGLKPLGRERVWSVPAFLEQGGSLSHAVGFGPGYAAHRRALEPVLPQLVGFDAEPGLAALVQAARNQLGHGEASSASLFPAMSHVALPDQAASVTEWR